MEGKGTGKEKDRRNEARKDKEEIEHAVKTVQRNLLLHYVKLILFLRTTVPPACSLSRLLTKAISQTRHSAETHYASINHCLH